MFFFLSVFNLLEFAVVRPGALSGASRANVTRWRYKRAIKAIVK